MSTIENSRRILAQEIADELFVNGFGQKAERLVLELPGKRDGGGWCRGVVIDVITKHLNKDPMTL